MLAGAAGKPPPRKALKPPSFWLGKVRRSVGVQVSCIFAIYVGGYKLI